MSTGVYTMKDTKKITFYATPAVAEWVKSLDQGQRSREINRILQAYITSAFSIPEKLSTPMSTVVDTNTGSPSDKSPPVENLSLCKTKERFYGKHQQGEGLQSIHSSVSTPMSTTVDTNIGDPSTEGLQKLRQEMKDLHEVITELKENNEKLEWQIRDLTDWKETLPGLRIFEELESDEVVEGLRALPALHIFDEIDSEEVIDGLRALPEVLNLLEKAEREKRK